MPTLPLTISTNEEVTLVEVWGGMQAAHTRTKNESKDTQYIWEGAQSASVLIYFVISLQLWRFYCKPLLYRLQMWLCICRRGIGDCVCPATFEWIFVEKKRFDPQSTSNSQWPRECRSRACFVSSHQEVTDPCKFQQQNKSCQFSLTNSKETNIWTLRISLFLYINHCLGDNFSINSEFLPRFSARLSKFTLNFMNLYWSTQMIKYAFCRILNERSRNEPSNGQLSMKNAMRKIYGTYKNLLLIVGKSKTGL